MKKGILIFLLTMLLVVSATVTYAQWSGFQRLSYEEEVGADSGKPSLDTVIKYNFGDRLTADFVIQIDKERVDYDFNTTIYILKSYSMTVGLKREKEHKYYISTSYRLW